MLVSVTIRHFIFTLPGHRRTSVEPHRRPDPNDAMIAALAISRASQHFGANSEVLGLFLVIHALIAPEKQTYASRSHTSLISARAAGRDARCGKMSQTSVTRLKRRPHPISTPERQPRPRHTGQQVAAPATVTICGNAVTQRLHVYHSIIGAIGRYQVGLVEIQRNITTSWSRGRAAWGRTSGVGSRLRKSVSA